MVAKWTSGGVFKWAKTLSGPTNDFYSGLGTDASNNVYVCGALGGTLSKAVLRSYTASGRLRWKRRGELKTGPGFNITDLALRGVRHYLLQDALIAFGVSIAVAVVTGALLVAHSTS